MLQIGDTVIITNQHLMSRNLIGTITECLGSSVAVKFDEWYDQRNKELTFNINNVQKVTNNNNNLNKGKEKENKKMAKLTGYKKVAEVLLGCSKYYYALYTEPVEEGSLITVSGRASSDILTVNRVLTVEEAKQYYNGTITAEVTGVVDKSAYNVRMAKRTEKERIKKEMDDKIKEMDELDKYRRYAEINPELKGLYERLADLQD